MVLNILLYLTFILFSFGQLGRISFLGQQINLYLYEIFVFFIILYLFVKYKFKPLVQSLNRLKIIYLFFLFIFIGFFVDLKSYSFEQNLVSFLYQARLWLYFTFFIYFLYEVKRNSTLSKKIIFPFLIFVVLTIASSIVQYFLYPDLRNVIYAGWDPHLYRLFGVFFDTFLAGAVYGLIFIFLLKNTDRLPLPKFINKTLLIIFFIFIFFTYSRWLFVAFFLTVLIMFFKKRTYKNVAILLMLFAGLIFLLPKQFGEGVNLLRTTSIKTRIADYPNAVSLWLKKPIFGYGYNRLRYISHAQNLESHAAAGFSSFLIVLVAGGVIGFLLFLASLINQTYSKSTAGDYLIFVVLLSLADNVILHPFVIFLLIMITSYSSPRVDS